MWNHNFCQCKPVDWDRDENISRHIPDPNDGAMELYNCDVCARSRHWPVTRAGTRHRALRAQVKMCQSMWASSTCVVNNAEGLTSFPSGPHFCAALLLSKQLWGSQQHRGFAARLCPSPGSWGALQGSAMSPNQGHQGHGDTEDPTSSGRWCPSCQKASSGSELKVVKSKGD